MKTTLILIALLACSLALFWCAVKIWTVFGVPPERIARIHLHVGCILVEPWHIFQRVAKHVVGIVREINA